MNCIYISCGFNLPFDLELLDFQLLQPSQRHPEKQQGPSISIFCVIMELFCIYYHKCIHLASLIRLI